MESILYDIRQALSNNLYYAAIMLSLGMPDLCAALESDDGKTTHQDYKRWFREWFQPKYPLLTEDDIYSLRCGVFHRGRLNDPRPDLSYDRIVFTLPAPNQVVMRQCVLNRAFLTDASRFCWDMTDSVNGWYQANENHPNVSKNIMQCVQYRVTGLRPYIAGVPVVA
jgi:hypothetical protein